MLTRIPSLMIAAAVALAAATAADRVAAQGGAGEDGHIERIAAVVNDDVITTSELQARLRLALLAANLEPTDENRRRLLPQVLRSLIDEEIREQEIRRYDISVPEDEVARTIAGIANQNNLTPQQLATLLSRNGVPLSALEDQIRNALAWRELIQQRIVPTINVSEEQIDEVLTRMEANRGRPEYLLAEIFLAVDDPAQDEEVRQFAEELTQEIRRGAPFSGVARQFSQGAGATLGGDLGWVLSGQLEPAIDDALNDLQSGQLSDPIRTAAGYHIILLRDQRQANVPDPLDTIVTMHRLGLAFPPGASAAQARQIAATLEEVSETVRGCEQLAARAEEVGAPPTDAGSGPLRELPPELAAVLADLPVGEPSEPLRLSDGIAVFMVCDRQQPDTASRAQIADNLGEERADMLQRRYLRDLRNAAFIDVRI